MLPYLLKSRIRGSNPEDIILIRLSETKKPEPDKDENNSCSQRASLTRGFFDTCATAPQVSVCTGNDSKYNG